MTTLPPQPPPAPGEQTVNVNLPPDVVDRLTQPHYGVLDWLYNNGANLGAALIAIAAAALAYRAVMLQVAKDDSRQRRSERLSVVTEALIALDTINAPHSDPEPRRPSMLEIDILSTKLRVVGMGAAANALKDYVDAVQSYGPPPHSGDGMHLSRLRDHVRRHLATVIDGQAIGPPPPAGT